MVTKNQYLALKMGREKRLEIYKRRQAELLENSKMKIVHYDPPKVVKFNI